MMLKSILYVVYTENILGKLHMKMKILKIIMVKNRILCNAQIIRTMDLEYQLSKYIHRIKSLYIC